MQRCSLVTFWRGVAFALLGATLLLGRKVMADVTIEKVTYNGWADSYHLTNGTVEVVVVPAVARVMRYAFVGGANILWENPTLAGKPGEAGKSGWQNFGGDKVWPWPQADWPKRVGGGEWPPPPATDQVPHTAEIIGKGTVRLTSPLVIGFGLRIVREVTLADKGTTVTVTSKFVKVRDGAAFPVAVWAILQTGYTDGPMVSRLRADSSLKDGWKRFGDGETVFKSLVKDGNLLTIERPAKEVDKIGIDGDLLAGLLGDTLLTVHATADTGGEYRPGDRAQIYNDDDDEASRKAGIAPYVEWEFTSPLKTLKKGETLTLTTVWELERLLADKRTPEAVARKIRGKN